MYNKIISFFSSFIPFCSLNFKKIDRSQKHILFPTVFERLLRQAPNIKPTNSAQSTKEKKLHHFNGASVSERVGFHFMGPKKLFSSFPGGKGEHMLPAGQLKKQNREQKNH